MVTITVEHENGYKVSREFYAGSLSETEVIELVKSLGGFIDQTS